MIEYVRKKASRHGVRFGLLVGLLSVVLLSSCSRTSSGDLSDLLKTVPSDASLVMACDVRSMLDKAGCKVGDGGEVKLTPDMEKIIASISDSSVGDNVRAVLSGEAGVAPTTAVFFREGEDSFLTFLLDNPDKFMTFAESVTGEKPVADGEVNICGFIARLANQGWIRVDNKTALDAVRIQRYAGLSESQSFVSSDMAEKFGKASKDIVTWADINGLLNLSGLSFSDRTVARMGLSSLYDDAAYIWSESDFGKGKFEVSARVLNSKGEDARCNFPASKIDVKTVASLGGKADIVIAGSISRQLSRQLESLAAGSGGGIGAMYAPLLKPLDGTFALAFSGLDKKSGTRVVVTTDGKSPVSDLMSMLTEAFGTVTRDGKFLRVAGNGGSEGGLDLAVESKRFSGAWLGVMADRSALGYAAGENDYGKGISLVVFEISPDGNTLEMKLELVTDKDTNSLVALLGAMSR